MFFLNFFKSYKFLLFVIQHFDEHVKLKLILVSKELVYKKDIHTSEVGFVIVKNRHRNPNEKYF